MTKTFFLNILLAITPLLVAGQKSNESTVYHYTEIEIYDNVVNELTEKRIGSIDIILNSGEHPYVRIVDDKMVFEYTIDGPPERKKAEGLYFSLYKTHPLGNPDVPILFLIPDNAQKGVFMFTKIELTVFFNPDEDEDE